MALIKCPECGGEVSTTAPQCVHCGCKITVCPDCGHAAVGEISTCPECGCVISAHKKETVMPTVTPVSTEQSTRSDGIDLEELRKWWLESSTVDSVLFTKQKIITKITDIIGWGLLVVAAVLIIVLCNGSDIEKLTDYQSTLASVRSIIIAAVVIILFSEMSGGLCNLVLTMRLANRLNRENGDIVGCLKKMNETTTTEDSKTTAFAKLFLNAAYACKNNSGKPKLVLERLIMLVCAAVLAVGCMLFLLDNVDTFTAKMCFDISLDIDYTMLIVAGVGLALTIAYALIHDLVIDEKIKDWGRKFANIG